MSQKRKLFVYDRKEVGILILLGVMVSLFAFTLGVHLGKKVKPEASASNPSTQTTETTILPPAAQETPAPSQLNVDSADVKETVQKTLESTLREEIAKTGLKENPEDLKENEAKNTTNSEVDPEDKKANDPRLNTLSESKSLLYTLQVASFPTEEEAIDRIKTLERIGVNADLKFVDLKQMGKWHRVQIGDFISKEAAQNAGLQLVKESKIKTFIVVKK